MGFFDSLFGSKKATNVEVTPQRIWMTTDAKFAGLAREVMLNYFSTFAPGPTFNSVRTARAQSDRFLLAVFPMGKFE